MMIETLVGKTIVFLNNIQFSGDVGLIRFSHTNVI